MANKHLNYYNNFHSNREFIDNNNKDSVFNQTKKTDFLNQSYNSNDFLDISLDLIDLKQEYIDIIQNGGKNINFVEKNNYDYLKKEQENHEIDKIVDEDFRKTWKEIIKKEDEKDKYLYEQIKKNNNQEEAENKDKNLLNKNIMQNEDVKDDDKFKEKK